MDADVLQEVLVQFRNEEDAVRQGLIKALRAHSEDEDPDVEHGGIVFRDPQTGRFYLAGGGPMRGKKDNIEIRGRKQKADDVLAAAYHTHPAKDTQGVFSGLDTAASIQTGIPFYMGKMHDQTARVFDARTDKIRQERRSVRKDQESPGRSFMNGAKMVPEDLNPEILAMLRAE